MQSLKMPQGLGLQISHHPLTMKQVASLIIAVERLKVGQPETVLSSEFRDEHLLDLMIDHFIEEYVCEVDSSPVDQFIRRSENTYTVTDSQKRNLLMVQSSMELHAVMLQGGQSDLKVHLNMSTYVHPTPSTDARPVALCIKNTALYLSCHKDGETPTLHLETVADKSTLAEISPDSDMMRFLFYKRKSGLNMNTLMSASYPGWYISTAEQDNKPVALCQSTSSRHQIFNMQRLVDPSATTRAGDQSDE
ncbi:interleukin-1 beta-like [Thalassophryne amazonica]|uniref:interleukin-1 beta-like n=1 Tax=Thalassophryne amazonica TaxID=390379 RepID=UPI0014725F1C|nr:interleukin-1 beta-like [Thalassophryne amazonica]XP_034026707.1 interleukin-1 beta-like [Thalassophryne amazonica]